MSDEKIIEKIRKLLRLSRSPNHHEAMAALAKAHELAASAGIAIDGVDADKEQIRITTDRSETCRRSYARKCCAGILRRHLSVVELGSSNGCIYVGPAVNIELAKHVQKFLIAVCSREWNEHVKSMRIRKSSRTNRRKTFELAFFNAVDNMLLTRPIRNDAEEVIRAIDAYISKNMVTRRDVAARPTRINHNDCFAGYRAGKMTSISRPIDAGRSSMQLEMAAQR